VVVIKINSYKPADFIYQEMNRKKYLEGKNLNLTLSINENKKKIRAIIILM
jgi:hypothetical protein